MSKEVGLLANWDLYETRMTIDGNTEKEIQVSSMKNSVLNNFDNSPSYFLALKNGIEQEFNIVEESVLATNANKKKIICKPDETIVVGDIIVFDNSNWICTESDTTSEIYDVGIINRCNNTLKFYSSPTLPNQNSNLIEVPCIIGKGNLGLDNNKFLSLPADENVVVCPNTIDSLKIDANTRFILSRDAYSVVGIDKITTPGLLTIRIKEGQVNTVDDNLDLNIANYHSHQHTYTISILNGSSAQFRQNETLQLNVQVSDKSIVLSPTPTVTYSSSDTTVCTADVNGLITGVGVGNCTITASSNGVSSTIAIVVSAVIYDNFSVLITGATTVKLNNNLTLTASVLNNGVVDEAKTVMWSIHNQDSSSNVYLSVISQTGNNITLKATSNSNYVNKYVVIRAEKSDDFSKYFDFVVQIKSLM